MATSPVFWLDYRLIAVARRIGLFLLLLASACGPVKADENVKAAGETFFENKIRPLLAKHCFECHSEDAQEGELRLDRRGAMLAGGRSGKAVLPGDPAGSLLIRVIRRVDQDMKMPPDDAKKLSAEEIEQFTAWVKMGAPFPGSEGEAPVKGGIDLDAARKFWSLQPRRATPPAQGATTANAANEIDQFILERLQAAKLTPSREADRAVLLRRATYDLTGLPPTADEIKAFLADTSTEAFGKVIDRLLDSPQYGVHWGRHWLDVARYGDTRWVGAGEDKRWPFAYTYRDWVIQAINEDIPYDRFVTLQLAADQTPDARPADQAALGFLTVGRWFTGTMPDVIDDQIDVVTRGLLGLSVQCARCHNHKYDPISTQDYYSLYGLFASARMPVDGSGLIAELPEVAPRPVEAAVEREAAALQAKIDDFIKTRLEALRAEFRSPAKLQLYLLAAENLLPKTDKDVREHLKKSSELDERLAMRWVNYLRNTAKKPHPIFAPWHALAALPEADFAAQAPATIEKVKAEKLNRYVVEILAPAPASLNELRDRYVELFLKHDSAEVSTDVDREAIRQVLRKDDSPTQLPANDLLNYLTAPEKEQLQAYKRELASKLVVLSERADLFLSYQRDAAPILAELDTFLKQRRAATEADIRLPEKIANALLTARDSETLPENKLRSTIKSRQLSERLVRSWIEHLRGAAQQGDNVFAAWRVFAAAADKDFASPANAELAKRACQATKNKTVAAAFEMPPKSLADAAKTYAELILKFSGSEKLDNVEEEAIRQVSAAADSPLRFSDRDAVEYFTQKDVDELKNKERKLLRLAVESLGAPARAMALKESSRGYAQRVFVRGNPNVQGEPAHGGFLSVLASGEPRGFQHGRGRLELAESIVDPRNPLTARVIVNRVWQWHFGAGLVPTPSDFGVRGTPPTHPELLEWLAQKFIDDGWSLKKLHRRILLSSTWRQSSEDNAKHRAIDPDNRLLWRMNRHRLGFEEIRDSLLAVAGRLDTTLGGRAIDITNSNARRRTAYGAVDRVTLPGVYRYFDFPGSEAHTPERQETIVAQQALYLMNNQFAMEQAGYAAKRTAGEADTAARIERLYQTIFGRAPSLDELRIGAEYIRSQATAETANAPASPADAWHYGWGVYDEQSQRVADFHLFPFFGNNTYKGGAVEIDPLLGRASLNQRGGTAGPSSELAVIRRWTAPRDGQLSIEGSVSSQPHNVQPLGDGVRARIISSRHGQLGAWIVHGSEETTAIENIAVVAGDMIDFVVDARGRSLHGSFMWAPILHLPLPNAPSAVAPDAGQTSEDKKADKAKADKAKAEKAKNDKNVAPGEKILWDAAKDYKGSPVAAEVYDAWQRYAQVLLQTNEFMFVD